MKLNLASLAGLVVVGVAAGLRSAPAHAAEPPPRRPSRPTQKERADCEAGRTAEDRATCLKEAGAAQQERKRNTLDNTGSTRQNAIERCNMVAPKDKADCLARIEGPSQPNQTTTTSGSVAGGGVHPRDDDHHDRRPTVVIVPAHAGGERAALSRRRRAAARPSRPAAAGARRRRRAAAILASPSRRGRHSHHRHRVGHQLVARASPSPDGITACAEVRALAEVYALMVYYHESECDEASMPAGRARRLARLVRDHARRALHRDLLDQPGRRRLQGLRPHLRRGAALDRR